MDTANILPPEMQGVLDALSAQTPEVRAIFRYALILLMIDDERARVLGTRIENGQTLLQVRTIGGDEFEVERPALGERAEKKLLDQIREIVTEEQEG